MLAVRVLADCYIYIMYNKFCRILQNSAESSFKERLLPRVWWPNSQKFSMRFLLCFLNFSNVAVAPFHTQRRVLGKSPKISIFCRIKNPQLLQNENHRNSAEIENLVHQLKTFDLEKIIHRKLALTRQQPQNASEITPLLFFIGFWRPPEFSAMLNLPISKSPLVGGGT